MPTYQFTDTGLAARRLEYLADVFEASTRPFILEAVTRPPGLSVDLGCGPGYTTRLLAECTQCPQAVGIDNSERFLAMAQEWSDAQVSFVHHDVITVPFPVGPCDLLYCRFLMTHLTDPYDVLEKWSSQLQPDGLLLIDEVEWIQTSQPVFTKYLDIVTAMLESQSYQLYIGPVLHRMELPDSLRIQDSRVRRLSVDTHQAATMFYMNIQSWKHQPFIRDTYPDDAINEMEEALEALAGMDRITCEIKWGLRQMVLARQ